MHERLTTLLDKTRAGVRARDTGTWAEKERILLDSCHSKQRDFALDPGRRVCALVARGGGKTTGARARIVRRMLRTPKARLVYVATTRTQAEDLAWLPLKEIVEKLGIEATFSEMKLRCTFARNGASVKLTGADDKREIEKLRGQPFHEAIIDEAGSLKPQLLEHLIFRILGPRMGDYGGTIVQMGTPSHVLRGPFYDATRPGSELHRRYEDRDLPEFEGWGGWSFHDWNLEDAAKEVPAMRRLWDEALREKEVNGWGDDHPVWLREYKGRWAADDTEHVFRYQPHVDGRAWNQWEPKKLASGMAELQGKGWEFIYGMDLGYSDPFALEVFAYNPGSGDRTLYHVYEFEKRGMYAKSIAELLLGSDLDPDRPRGLLGVTGWPAAMVADTAGLGGALLDELSQVYGLKIDPAEKKSKHDAIELTNGDLIDGKIRILKDSRLEEQLQSLQWAEDMYGNIKEDKSQRNDCTDAFIYARRAAKHHFPDDEHHQPVQGVREELDVFTVGEDPAPRGEFDDILGDGAFEDFWGDL